MRSLLYAACFIHAFGLCEAVRPSDPEVSLATSGDECNNKVLFFAPVGLSYKSVVARNVRHLVDTGIIDIFLAHYSGNQSEWKSDWHDYFVKYSVFYQGAKVDFVHNELVEQRTFHLTSYCYYWISDENIGFSGMNVIHYLNLAQESGALITQPAVSVSGASLPSHDAVNAFTAPTDLTLSPSGRKVHSRCLYRFTDFVEVMSPMFRGFATLEAAYKLHNRSDHSDWGMDRVWCRYLASQFGTSPNSSCAVVDAEPMNKLPHICSYQSGAGQLANHHVLSQYSEFDQQCMLAPDMEWQPGTVQQCKVEGFEEFAGVRFDPKVQTTYLTAYVKCTFKTGTGMACWSRGAANATARLRWLAIQSFAILAAVAFTISYWKHSQVSGSKSDLEM